MIPLVRPVFPPATRITRHLKKSARDGQWTNFGPLFWEVTEKLKERSGRHELVCSSGTAAIRLALQTSGLPRGSRVLVPDFTHVGTLHAVMAAGMIPVLGPCLKEMWSLDPEAIRNFRGCGVIVVAPFGYSIDYEYYSNLCRALGHCLIFDAAGAYGAVIPKTPFPICYSLHATKNLSCGEGGIVSFNNSTTWEHARMLSNFNTGFDRMVGHEWGDNLKIDEFKCAMILSHLELFDMTARRIENKRTAITIYQELLKDFCIPHDFHQGKEAAPSLAVLGGLPAARIENACEAFGFTAKRYYIPLSRMPGLERVTRGRVSSTFFDTCLALPGDVSVEEAKTVVEGVRAIMEEKVGSDA